MKLGLVLRGNIWYISGSLPKVGRIYKSTGFQKPDEEAAYTWAVEYELGLIKNPHGLKYDSQPFKELVDQYVFNKPHMTEKEYSAISIVRKHLGDKPVKEVRTNLDEYIYTRHKKSKLNTICRDVDRRIRAIINFGRDKKWCGDFEVDCSEFRIDDTRTAYIEPDMVERLIAATPQAFKDFEMILQYQGLRFGQAKALTTSSMSGKHLRVTTNKGMKNGQTREILLPVFPKAREIIERRIKMATGKLLFPEIVYSTFRYNRLKACTEIGLMDYRIHDNRSSFITNVGQLLNLTPREAASLLGQESTVYVDRYWQKRDLVDKVNRL